MTDAPYSQEAEEAMLGGLLVNPNLFPLVADTVKPTDFFFLRHSYIFEAMAAIMGRGEPIDPVSLHKEMDIRGTFKEIGGAAYLTELITKTPTSAHTQFYAALVERCAIRRNLMQTADEYKLLAVDETRDIESIILEAQQRLQDRVINRIGHQKHTPISEIAHTFMDELDHKLQFGEGIGVKTGIADLDALMIGGEPSDFIIFGGRPGMGKTSALINFAKHALDHGHKVGIFSLEMSASQIFKRLATLETGITYGKHNSGQISQEEYQRLLAAARKYATKDKQLFINDQVGITPAQVRATARRWQMQHGLDVVFIDYIGLMRSGFKISNRVQEVSEISHTLKEVARELNAPVWALSQLSRAVEQRQDKRPILSDLRESGTLEADADKVVFVYRDVQYNPDTEFPYQMELIVAKHRNGPTGTVHAFFEKAVMRIAGSTKREVRLGAD